jgi:hypothetical protein
MDFLSVLCGFSLRPLRSKAFVFNSAVGAKNSITGSLNDPITRSSPCLGVSVVDFRSYSPYANHESHPHPTSSVISVIGTPAFK